MTQKSDRRSRSERPAQASSLDLSPLLEEIEKEQVPDRLLVLAQELQRKLAEKRRQEEAVDRHEDPPTPSQVRQSR